jgi:hypothetical protein
MIAIEIPPPSSDDCVSVPLGEIPVGGSVSDGLDGFWGSGVVGLCGEFAGLGVDSVGSRLQSNAGHISINAQLKSGEGELSNIFGKFCLFVLESY